MRCAQCEAHCINRGPGSLCRTCQKKKPHGKRREQFWRTIEKLEGLTAWAGAGGPKVEAERSARHRNSRKSWQRTKGEYRDLQLLLTPKMFLPNPESKARTAVRRRVGKVGK